MGKRIIMLLTAMCLLLTLPASAGEEKRPRIILMTCYQQVGWGVYADAVFLDEEGGIWFYESERGLPQKTAERLELLGETGDVRREGEIDESRLEEIQSLIDVIQPEEVKSSHGNIADYGLDTSSAIRYDEDGEAEIICLELSGDWVYEHSDEKAQALNDFLYAAKLGVRLDDLEAALEELKIPQEILDKAKEEMESTEGN